MEKIPQFIIEGTLAYNARWAIYYAQLALEFTIQGDILKSRVYAAHSARCAINCLNSLNGYNA